MSRADNSAGLILASSPMFKKSLESRTLDVPMIYQFDVKDSQILLL